jgi:hypothetical protein
MDDPERSQFVQQFESSSFNSSIPDKFQFARLSNATNYTYADVGDSNTVELAMKANILAGIFATDPFGDWSVPNYYCPSGNCTWIGHSSLGICSKCADLSSQLSITCNTKNKTYGCDVTLPNGFALGGPERSRQHLLAASTDNSPLVYGNYSAPLAVIQVIAAYDTLPVNTSASINAIECAIIPCVINYTESYLYSSPYNNQDGFLGVPFFEIVESVNDNYSFSTSASPWNGPIISTRAGGDQDIDFQISQPAYLTLSHYLQALFNGYVTTNGISKLYESDNKTRPVQGDVTDVMQSLYTPFNGGCYDIFSHPINDSAACSIQYAAWAMTTAVRNNYWNSSALGLNTYFTVGNTTSPELILIVSWPWIIPIGLLWVFCALFSLYTIWRTHRAGINGMALNPLTFLFLSLEVNGQPVPPWWRSGSEMEKVAAHLPVRLKVTDRKASLVQGPSPNRGVIQNPDAGSSTK